MCQVQAIKHGKQLVGLVVVTGQEDPREEFRIRVDTWAEAYELEDWEFDVELRMIGCIPSWWEGGSAFREAVAAEVIELQLSGDQVREQVALMLHLRERLRQQREAQNVQPG